MEKNDKIILSTSEKIENAKLKWILLIQILNNNLPAQNP